MDAISGVYCLMVFHSSCLRTGWRELMVCGVRRVDGGLSCWFVCLEECFSPLLHVVWVKVLYTPVSK